VGACAGFSAAGFLERVHCGARTGTLAGQVPGDSAVWAIGDRGKHDGHAAPRCPLGWLALLPTLLTTACAPSDDYFTKVDATEDGGRDGGRTSNSSTTTNTTGLAGSPSVSGSTTDTGGSNGSGGNESGGHNGSGGDAGNQGGSGGNVSPSGTGGMDGSGGSGGDPASGGTGGMDGSGGSGGDPASGGTGGSGGADCVPEDEICDGQDNDCNQMIDDDACEAGCAGFLLNGQTYMYCGESIVGWQIENRCADNGMIPVRIDSAQENTALVDAVQLLDAEYGEPNGQQRAFWIGVSNSDDEGTWLWLADGTVFWIGTANGMAVDGAYNNWGAGKPNSANTGGEDCAAMYIQSGEDGALGEWNDLDCSDGYSVVCESP